jgi:hypothetical protein
MANAALVAAIVAIVMLGGYSLFLTNQYVIIESKFSVLQGQVSQMQNQLQSMQSQVTQLQRSIDKITGSSSQTQPFEKLGIASQYATALGSDLWNISLGGANTGNANSVVSQIQVNGIPITCSNNQLRWEISGSTTSAGYGLPFTIPSMSSFTLFFLLGNNGCSTGNSLTGGQTVQITLITSVGNNYPATLVLPSYILYEKVGIATQYATGSSTSGWVIYLGGQNTGNGDASITQIQINGVPYPISGNTACTSLPTGANLAVCWTNASNTVTTTNNINQATLNVPAGSDFAIELGLPSNPGPSLGDKLFADGQTIQVTIITAAGNNYPASVVLP